MIQLASDTPPLPGEDHAEARDRTIENLKVLGLAMSWYAHVHDGRFPPRRDPQGGQAAPELAGRPPAVPRPEGPF